VSRRSRRPEKGRKRKRAHAAFKFGGDSFEILKSKQRISHGRKKGLWEEYGISVKIRNRKEIHGDHSKVPDLDFIDSQGNVTGRGNGAKKRRSRNNPEI